MTGAKKYDVIVIGAGPAGMMAAISSASCGAETVILEKNTRPGRKLLITGNSRCNLANSERNMRTFASAFGDKAKYLHSIFNSFTTSDTISFFKDIGVDLKTEDDGKVFPESGKASEVVHSLEKTISEKGAKIIYDSPVEKIFYENSRIISVESRGKIFSAESYIIATGGKSYPATGSTGDGYTLASTLGHTVVDPVPSLVPIVASEKWIPKAEGVSIADVKLTLYVDGKKTASESGGMIFTSSGISGPAAINLSRHLARPLVEGKKIYISADLCATRDQESLEQFILDEINYAPNRLLKNMLDLVLPKGIISVIAASASVDSEKKCNNVTRDERKRIISSIKDMRLAVKETEGFGKAVITSGGISLDEIDMRTMKSRLIENLFFAGEVIDADGKTGGYNLQLCWSSGHVSGTSAAKQSSEKKILDHENFKA